MTIFLIRYSFVNSFVIFLHIDQNIRF